MQRQPNAVVLPLRLDVFGYVAFRWPGASHDSSRAQDPETDITRIAHVEHVSGRPRTVEPTRWSEEGRLAALHFVYHEAVMFLVRGEGHPRFDGQHVPMCCTTPNNS